MQNTLSSELAPYAMNPNKSKGRLYDLKPSNLFIDNFQEDVLRIIRSTSFRRLAHKTQVFINDSKKVDHYRSRLTHTLEASMISRIISMALNLSTSLTEAICLAHDMGHPPFGHSGEDILNELLLAHGGFNHNYYALKLITKLEEKHLGYDGLNLSWETLEGIIKHNGPLIGQYAKMQFIPNFIMQYNEIHDLHLDKFASLEAQVASVSDDIAYASHDLEDGLSDGLFSLESFLAEAAGDNFKIAIGQDERRSVHELMFAITNFFIQDVIASSTMRIKKLNIRTIQDVTSHNEAIISFSENGLAVLQRIKAFLRKNMYFNEKILRLREEYRHIICDVYNLLLAQPSHLPKQWAQRKGDLPVLIGDYIGGMTDSFIIKLHKSLL